MDRIQIRELSKNYKEKVVLDCIDYVFEDKMYLITGPNGSGKSTLLKCIIHSLNYHGQVQLYSSREIAYLPEKSQVPSYVSVFTFIRTMLSEKKDTKDILAALTKWGLLDAKDKMLYQLSKGMLQKVMLSYIFLQQSDIYILDEPLGGLDTNSQEIFLKELETKKQEKKCILVTTHYPGFIVHLSDVVLEYNRGKFV